MTSNERRQLLYVNSSGYAGISAFNAATHHLPRSVFSWHSGRHTTPYHTRIAIALPDAFLCAQGRQGCGDRPRARLGLNISHSPYSSCPGSVLSSQMCLLSLCFLFRVGNGLTSTTLCDCISPIALSPVASVNGQLPHRDKTCAKIHLQTNVCTTYRLTYLLPLPRSVT